MALDTTPPLPMNGKDAKVRLFIDGTPDPEVEALCLSWSLSEKAQIFQDGYAGRKRKRNDKQIDGYELSMELHVASMALYRKLRAVDDAREANTTIPDIAIGLEFAERSGAFEGLIAENIVTTIDISGPGQSERLKQSLKITAENVEPTTF